MFKKNRIIAAALAVLLFIPSQMVYANPAHRTDDFIFSDPVLNTFTGHQEGALLVNNLRFNDMPADPLAQDAIIRSGVYNLIKGEAPLFRPNSPMTIQEALAFALRAAGYEAAALAAGAAELDQLPVNATAQDALYLGYLALARNMGLITEGQFTEAFAPPPAPDADLPAEVETFRRAQPATREEFAHWLALAITSRDATAFNIDGPFTQVQAVYRFLDWNTISPERVQSIEQLARTNIMTGHNNRFRPTDPITRMEAAWAGRALDSIFHEMAGLERHFGTVGGIADAQAVTAHMGTLWREIRVRRDDGRVDMLRFTTQVGGSPQEGTQDAVVLKNGAVGGLGTLSVGDPIEYIVHTASETVLFVAVTGALASRTAMGRLQVINTEAGTATFLDNYGRAHTYALAQGLLREGPEGIEVRMDIRWYALGAMPLGSLFSIELVNNMITSIQFAGGLVIEPETWGVVIANNPMLGYLTIFDAHGNERTFGYNAAEIVVHRTEHYDMRNTIGGIHAMFPNVSFNPRETTMASIEPGNVVSIRLDPANPTMIASIHASTFYTTRYGRILEFNTQGNMHNFLMEFENGRTAMFNMADGVMVRRGAIPINAGLVQPGEWARVLINQAIIGQGNVLESVRALDVEVVAARAITSIWVGNLSGINTVQNQLLLANASEFFPSSSFDFRNVAQFNIANPQIEFYFNGDRVSLGHVNEFLRHSNALAVVAIENAHGGERVRVASFFESRHEPLNPDTVVGVDGHGGFHILSNDGLISTHDGTIVVRNGNLVSGRQIMPWDHATVALYRENRASVVIIDQTPGFAGVQIVRGRVQSVDQGRSFRVQSMALFDGLDWHFTPIEREFTIDNNTLFMNADGITDINDFIDFTADTVVDRVFNIVVDGSRAARVIDAPYATQAIRGIIYNIDGDTIYLRDVHVREPHRDAQGNPLTGRWHVISLVNATGTATIQNNTIIVDRNQVVGLNNLQVGQQVRVITTSPLPNAVPGMNVTGFIVLVER